MGRKYSGKRWQKWLTAVVLAGLAGSSFALAEASSISYVAGGGKTMFEIDFLDQGESCTLLQDASGYTLSPALKAGVCDAAYYWADILGAGAKNDQPVQVFVNTMNQLGNASAVSNGLHIAASHITSNQLAWKQVIQNGKTEYGRPLIYMSLDSSPEHITDGEVAWGDIQIGQYIGIPLQNAEYGWELDKNTVLPTNGMACDYIGVIRHELGHALGISSKLTQDGTERDTAGNVILSFLPDITAADSWNMHLVDQYLNPAKPGMKIVTSAYFKELQAAAPGLKRSDFFIVDNLQNKAIAYDTTIPTAGKLYFVGSHVTETLDGATFDGVSGVPVTAWEDSSTYKAPGPNFSHLETKNGMMSHQDYRNYNTFLEIELAVMQDIGYCLDRKKYYGRSIYTSSTTLTNSQGYSARNAEGTAYLPNVYSTVPLGIGLHVYGSKNHITQTGNILTWGDGAVGMRIDGTENTITEAAGTAIHADGYRGIGALVCYGRNQVLDQQGTITARGTGGNGIQFDFGSNLLGTEERGSYIRYLITVDEKTGAVTKAVNSSFAADVPELGGPLVRSYTLSGTLSGAANAIYISKNAFVQDIQVEKGAAIVGNITSEWKHFPANSGYDGIVGDGSDALKIQYNGGSYAYSAYIPALVTNLNFNTDMDYAGNITGRDNLKLKVNHGTLRYGGSADVVGVQVASGAVLAGGTYTVNDMTAQMAAGFSDDTTGKLINHGTIQPAAADMTIHGQLLSDGGIGLVSADGQQAQQIMVDGKANIQGSQLVRVDGSAYLPDKSYTFLTAGGGLSGNFTNTQGSPFTGLLNIQNLALSDNSGMVTLKLANNLGTLDGNQQWVYDSLPDFLHHTQTGSMEQTQLARLLGASPAAASAGLASAAQNGTADSAAMTMSSLNAMNAIGARTMYLSSVPAVSQSGMRQARLEEDAGTLESRLIPIDLGPTTSGWLKFTKSWESLGSNAANGHGFATSFGFDHSVGSWRLGEFFSYGDNSFASRNSSLKNKDYRLGLYGIREQGPRQLFLYFDLGQQNNDMKRSILAGGSYEADSSYKSYTTELGGRYAYDLDYGRNQSWHRKPYGEVQIVRYQQDGYAESGAGIWNQSTGSANSTYSAVTVGLGLEKKMKNEEIEVHLGYKRVCSGSDPTYPVRWVEGSDAEHMARGSGLDKNLVVLGLHAEQNQEDGWRLSGDVELEQGHSQRNLQASVMLKKSW